MALIIIINLFSMPDAAILTFSFPQTLARALNRAARSRAMTRSEYVRELVRRDLAFAPLRELQRETARRAPKAGIRTLEDAVRAVRALRGVQLK